MKKQPTKKSGRKRRNEMKLLVFNLINAERYIRSKEKLCEPGFYACCTRKWIYALVCCLFVSFFILWQREEKKIWMADSFSTSFLRTFLSGFVHFFFFCSLLFSRSAAEHFHFYVSTRRWAHQKQENINPFTDLTPWREKIHFPQTYSTSNRYLHESHTIL